VSVVAFSFLPHFHSADICALLQTSIDDKNIKRMRIEHRYTKPRLPMPTDDDRITMLAEQVFSRPNPNPALI
jgi:hypothetical protein